jgi:predicted DNA-binding WGR domain protein
LAIAARTGWDIRHPARIERCRAGGSGGAVAPQALQLSRHHTKRRKPSPARPPPVQLPLFADTATLVRIRPELSEWRYYPMAIWPDLFGRALLVRQWGCIGTEGRRRFECRNQCARRSATNQAPSRVSGPVGLKKPKSHSCAPDIRRPT